MEGTFAGFFGGCLVMALVGGLIFKSMIRSAKKTLDAGHDVLAQKFDLEAEMIRKQVEDQRKQADIAGIKAEKVRQGFAKVKVATAEGEKELAEKRAERDQVEIQRREALRAAGIDPDAELRQRNKKALAVLATVFTIFTILMVSYAIIKEF